MHLFDLWVSLDIRPGVELPLIDHMVVLGISGGVSDKESALG